MTMDFARPYLVPLALALPVALLLLFAWAAARKRIALYRFAGSHLANTLTQSVSKARQRIKAALLILAVFLACLALAQPRWGESEVKARARGVEILIAVDVSKSMLAEDIRPNRITRARMEIRDLLSVLQGHKVGLIAFAGQAYLHCPPTTDLDACAIFLDSIDVGLIPRGGTHIGDAIRAANKVFRDSTAPQKVLVLITDGEDHDTRPIEAAQEARKLHVKIFAIGIGLPQKTPIPISDEKGNRYNMKDRAGNTVYVQLDEKTLQSIALETGGFYWRAANNRLELEKISEKINAMQKAEFEERVRRRLQHRYQIFLLLAFVALLVETCVSDRKHPVKQSLLQERT